MKILTEADCRKAMEKGEFELPPGKSALILAQSWCPQWKSMKNYLPDAEKSLPELNIFYIEYDLTPFFNDFLSFKENTLQNREIPYVRYYLNGKCTAESNFVSLDGFLQRCKS